MVVSRNSFASNSLQAPPNVIFFKKYGHYEAFSTLKLEQISCKEVLNFVLLYSSFLDYFAEV